MAWEKFTVKKICRHDSGFPAVTLFLLDRSCFAFWLTKNTNVKTKLDGRRQHLTCCGTAVMSISVSRGGSVRYGVTSSGIFSSDRPRRRTYSPPSHSQRKTVHLMRGRANWRAAQARRRFLLWSRCLGWVPNPICCGATDEDLAAVATHPRYLYSLALADEDEHSTGRVKRWVPSRIGWPSCCSWLPWSRPSDKTSYFVVL